MTKLRLLLSCGLFCIAALPSACRDGEGEVKGEPSSTKAGAGAGGSQAKGQAGPMNASAAGGNRTGTEGDSGSHSNGVGGSDGSAGGSSGGSANGNATAGYAWVHDPEAWREPDVVSTCRPSSAILEKLDFPGSEWTSCGAGCRALKPVRGEARVIADDYRSGMRVNADGVELYLSLGIMTDPVSVCWGCSTTIPTSNRWLWSNRPRRAASIGSSHVSRRTR